MIIMYVLVITRPGRMLLIYKHKPEGECLKISNILTGRVIGGLFDLLGGCSVVT